MSCAEFDSIQHERDLPSEVGAVLGTSDDVDTIDEIQAPDYLSMLMEYGEFRSDPQGCDSATPAKMLSKKGKEGKDDSIFPEEVKGSSPGQRKKPYYANF